jgi:hypothetical protein
MKKPDTLVGPDENNFQITANTQPKPNRETMLSSNPT